MKSELISNRRQHRADRLAHLIMQNLGRFIADDSRNGAMAALHRLLFDQGADVITDDMRKEAGLPPRDPLGWTAAELLAYEHFTLTRLAGPMMLKRTPEDIPPGSIAPAHTIPDRAKAES